LKNSGVGNCWLRSEAVVKRRDGWLLVA
jgi:hypothetical protein